MKFSATLAVLLGLLFGFSSAQMIFASDAPQLSEDQIDFIRGLERLGFLRIKPLKHEAHVNPEFWRKAGKAMRPKYATAFAMYVGAEKMEEQWITIYSKSSRKKLARFDRTKGYQEF